MPKRKDIKSVMILGAGPIVIGQACEFDYSGVQACKALREEGYKVILVNSNPATIMTDPDTADATYIEPIQWQEVEKIIAIEKPDAILATMGGQTALNCALDLDKNGVLKRFHVEMIGAKKEAIEKAEDRELFDKAMKNIGLETPRSAIIHDLDQARSAMQEIGFPCIIRPSFTMGGSGGGIAYNEQDYFDICAQGFMLSPTNELLVDESLIGWKEFEMEVVRDKNDNCIIVCSIENIDPMGVHTGDSITVAPAQTLTDKEYQIMRDASIAVLREIGVETGGSNVQFAVHPETGRLVVIEMNPRVSRSSALASKATGFPIAKVAAKLAVGYTLDELRNEITGGLIPCSFEPTIDYVVTKIPRFAFEKFPSAKPHLSTQMKSVGEVMAIGRTFQESLQKALRGLEIGALGLDPHIASHTPMIEAQVYLRDKLAIPSPERLFFVADAFRAKIDVDTVYALSHIDPWFLAQIQELVHVENSLFGKNYQELSFEQVLDLKKRGFSDARLAELFNISELEFRSYRKELGISPVYKRVDSCAAEFSSSTAYLYSTYEEECEARPTKRDKIMVLGGGPNRIGQGIEFDYCCVHAALAMREDNYETIMVNCNPETVSTDYDTSDRLYFEPITFEDVLEIIELEQPKGVIVQFGGQTPLKLARALEKAGVPIIGTSPDKIDQAEDRERFQVLINDLQLKQPPNGIVRTIEESLKVADTIGFPLVVRPSYVLGGRAMEIVHGHNELEHYMRTAVQVSNDCPVLLDSFLNKAIEIDVDAVSDGKTVVIGAIMQHVEEAGIHSGDSSCSLPPFDLDWQIQEQIREQVKALALALNVIGLMNVQLAVREGEIYILEVNPRASRTVPFVSKAIGVSLAKIAARVMAGKTLQELGFTKEIIPSYFSIKQAVFPFKKFQGVDPILGPEMRSTGEVMGIGENFAQAFASTMRSVGDSPPMGGHVILSVRDADKGERFVDLACQLLDLGFNLLATDGTAAVLKQANILVKTINKVAQGSPHIVDIIKSRDVSYIINTTEGKQAILDSATIRSTALEQHIYYSTTLASAQAVCKALQVKDRKIRRLQDLHEGIKQ